MKCFQWFKRPNVTCGFYGDCILKVRLDGETFEVMQDFGFRMRSGFYVCARPGDIVDGASIPRFWWRVIGSPMTGQYRRASVIHDVGCKYNREKLPRSTWDLALYEGMRADKCNPVKAWIIYRAVRAYAICTGKK